MEYFTNPKTLEELKKEYRKLATQYHPDVGGSTEAMQKINAEYSMLFDILKDVHINADGETYHKETAEGPEQFIEIINELIHFEGVIIEIIGSFIWVSGNSKPYREKLKDMNFRWSPNKSAWYLSPEGYKKHSHKDYSMNDIREMYGSQEVKTKPFMKILKR